MNLPPAWRLAVLTALALLPDMVAQETPPPTTAAPVRQPLFTEAQMERFRAIAAAQEAQRESYIRASEEDEVIVLEPYFVEGDDSLQLARIRRALELGVRAHRRRFFELSAETKHQLLLARRDDERFFKGHSPGAPADRVSTGPDLIGMSIAIVWELSHGSTVADLFRSPPGAPGE